MSNTDTMALLLLLVPMIAQTVGQPYYIPFSSAELSSTWQGYEANRAIDGDFDTIAHSECNNTGQEIWLKLWLSTPAWIDHFIIYPSHTDEEKQLWKHYYRLDGTQIFLEDLDSGEEILCGTLTLDTVKASHKIECSEVHEVQVVVLRLQKNKPSWACIHVVEIKAFGERSKL